MDLIDHSAGASLNFILSDGYNMWAFRRVNTLYSYYDSLSGYAAVASVFPTSTQGNWRAVDDYELIYMEPGRRPEYINLLAYFPPDVTCPGDTSLLYINTRPVCLTGFGATDPNGDLDTIFVNQGAYDKGTVCFNPNEGTNIIALTAIDGFGNQVSCSTFVEATLTFPGYAMGVVIDTNQIAISGVAICLDGTSIGDTTDQYGYYFISDIVPGNYSMTLSYPGFMDSTLTNIDITPGDTVSNSVMFMPGCPYVAGDANGSRDFNGLDVSYSVNYLKGFGPEPPFKCNCPVWGRFYSAADANGSCSFNGLDVTYSVSYLKGMGPAPQGCQDCPPARGRL